ncbi:MAG: RsiV family protein [Trueperaceae bacterium]
MATRLTGVTRLDDDSFEVRFVVPFFYAPPYASLDLSAPDLARAPEAWTDGLHERRARPDAATGSWRLERTADVRSLSPTVISVLTRIQAYAGGAHPNAWFKVRTWVRDDVSDDARWGRAARPCDVLAALRRPCDPDRLRRAVIVELERQDAAWVVAGEVHAGTAWLLDPFTVDPTGLTFRYAAYEVGPYAQGPFEAHVPFTALASDGR